MESVILFIMAPESQEIFLHHANPCFLSGIAEGWSSIQRTAHISYIRSSSIQNHFDVD